MLHGFVGGNLLDVAEPGAGAHQIPCIPELRRPERRLLPMLPAAFGPPALLLVAAIVDELPPFPVGHRNAADAKRGHVDDMCGSLVVE